MNKLTIISIVLILIFTSFSTKAQSHLHVKFIDTLETEMVLFKFMKLENLHGKYYYRDVIYFAPKQNIRTDDKSICSNFTSVITLRSQSYSRLVWNVNHQDSINLLDKYSPNAIRKYNDRWPNYSFIDYKIDFDGLPVYKLNKHILFSVLKIKTKGALVYFDDIKQSSFLQLYTSWDELIGCNCMYKSSHFFIFQVISQSNIEDKYINCIFDGAKISKKKLHKSSEG